MLEWKKISPRNIFGGIWERIYGRFLFASDTYHQAGSKGGEERHYLTIEEMINHFHGYDRFNYDNWNDTNLVGSAHCPTQSGINFLVSSTKGSCGGGKSHNNMPPYITANCSKRTG